MRVTLAITLGLIGLEIVRFLLFLVCRLFGYSIWIFPDLDRDDKGLFGVFYPLISVEAGDDIACHGRSWTTVGTSTATRFWRFWWRFWRSSRTIPNRRFRLRDRW